MTPDKVMSYTWSFISGYGLCHSVVSLHISVSGGVIAVVW